MEEALSSFNAVAPVVNQPTICMEKFLRNVAGVAVHAGYAWLDGGLCNVVDDLIIQQ